MCWHIGEGEPPRGAGSVFDASPPPSMRDTTRQDPEQPPERHCRPNVARDVWLHPDHQTVLPFIGLLSHSFFGHTRSFQPTGQLGSLLPGSVSQGHFRCAAAADLSNAVSWRLGSLDPSARNHHEYARLKASKRSVESACRQPIDRPLTSISPGGPMRRSEGTKQ
jgi:hypothetical protein